MAGGVPAGRLSIEIVAEVARLTADLQKVKGLVNAASKDIASSARAANDNLAGIGRNAGAGVQQFSRNVAALKAQLDPAWASLQRYKQEVQTLQQALREGAITHKQYVDQLRGAVSVYQQSGQGVRAATGQMRAGVQQLSYNIGDMGTQLAAATQATDPFKMALTAIVQQSGQTVQAVQLMTGSTKGFIGFMAGPWGAVIMGAVSILGMMASSYFTASDAAKAQKEAADDLVKSIATLEEAVRSETNSQAQNTAERLKNAFAMRQQAAEALKLAQAELSRQKIFLAGADDQQGNAFSSQQYVEAEGRRNNAIASMDAQLAQIKKLQGEINKTDASIRGLQAIAINARGATYFDKGADATRRFDTALGKLAARFRDGKIGVNEYAAEAAKLRGGLHAEQEAIEAANKSHRKRKGALSEAAKAAREAAKEFEKLAKWIADTRMEAQGNVGKLAQDIQKQQQDWGKGLLDLRAKIDTAWGDNALAGLSGSAREFAELNIEIEALRKQFTGAGMDAVALEQALEDYRAARTAGINQKTMLEKDADAAARLLDTLGAITNMRGALGSLAGIVGGLMTGDFSRVGGGLGRILEIASSAVGEDGWKAITNKLDQIFGGKSGDGTFARSMTNVLANAAFGSTAASMTGGSKLGGAAGGVIGGKLGEKLLEKPLKDMFGEAFGSLAGPLGSMLGGVLGGAIGGMFKKVKWGAVDISASGVSASRGNSSTAEKAAVSVGDNIMASLNQIAEAFGGAVGDFGNITVGQRHGDWRVNATGTSLKVKKGATDFNDDAEGAIAYAIQVAIERGAITGIRESTQTLLQASGDLQTKLSKALAFEGVFSDLKQATDPVGYELEDLTKKFDGLRKIFAEAGATTEEYTQLEQLLSIQRKGILDQAENERRELEVRLLTAQGKAAEAANLQREIELSQTKDDLKLLMKQVQAEELASQRRSMEITLLEAMGKSTEALTLRRQAELAAMDESLRPLQRSIWYYQDAAQKVSDARDALSAAYSRESSSLQSTADKFRDFAKAISEFRASLFTDVPGVDSYALARSRFDKTANLARLGNEASLSAFTGDAQSYLDAARDRAGSALDYARDVARVAAAADQAQAGANGVASMAERQLNQLTASVKGLIDLNDNVTTVWQAIADLEKAQAEEAEAQAEMDKLTNPVPQLQEVNINLTDIGDVMDRLSAVQADTKQEIAALRAEMQPALIAIASNTGESARILRRADRGDALATQVEAA